MELLKIDNLCKVYGRGENQVTALDHVSLTIEKGEFAAIIGPSGSGKSTLLHIIGGVDVPTSGKVYLDGQDVYAGNSENKKYRQTLIVVTHDENIALQADRIIGISDGKVVRDERMV